MLTQEKPRTREDRARVPQDHRSRASTTCASASASRSATPSSRGATRRRATTSATTRTASATTTRCGAIPTTRRRRRYGGIVALPSFLFATSRIISGYVGGLPGVHAMWSGADWTWHKPVRRNDVISTEAYLKDLIEHETRFAGRAIQQIYHVDFFNQHGRQGRRGRQLVLPHRARPRAREGHQVQGSARARAAPLHRRGARRRSTSCTRTRRSAARSRATGKT